MATISALYIYPVKSLAGFSVASATLGERGLCWRNQVSDRQWMLVLPNGRFVTQRQWPQLAQIKTELTDNALILHHPTLDAIAIPYDYDRANTLEVTVWRDQVLAFDEGEQVANWLAKATDQLDSGVRLVRFGKESEREVSPKHLAESESARVGFADGYPILITNTASLEQFNRHLRQSELKPLSMNRFRANVVLTNLQPWQENEIQGIAQEDRHYQLGLRKPCERCPMITVDQQSGEKPALGAPLKALMALDVLGDGKAYFGQNAIVTEGIGELIKVGDRVLLS